GLFFIEVEIGSDRIAAARGLGLAARGGFRVLLNALRLFGISFANLFPDCALLFHACSPLLFPADLLDDSSCTSVRNPTPKSVRPPSSRRLKAISRRDACASRRMLGAWLNFEPRSKLRCL